MTPRKHISHHNFCTFFFPFSRLLQNCSACENTCCSELFGNSPKTSSNSLQQFLYRDSRTASRILQKVSSVFPNGISAKVSFRIHLRKLMRCSQEIQDMFFLLLKRFVIELLQLFFNYISIKYAMLSFKIIQDILLLLECARIQDSFNNVFGIRLDNLDKTNSYTDFFFY